MKALSETILLVVSAVVILVVALVVLMIFTQGTGNANELLNYKNNCITTCSVTCKMNAMPPTWGMSSYVPSLKKDSNCQEATGIKDCGGCGGTSTSPTTTTGGSSGCCQTTSSTCTPVGSQSDCKSPGTFVPLAGCVSGKCTVGGN